MSNTLLDALPVAVPGDKVVKRAALDVLTLLARVRGIPDEEARDKAALWNQIVQNMKAFPKAKAGLRVVYASPLKRAMQTAELAAVTANNLPEVQFSAAIKEILLTQEFDEELTQLSESILAHSADRSQAFERLESLYAEHGRAAPMADTPENRQHLADPTAVFAGGDSTQAYAARIVKGYTAILTHAMEGGQRPLEDILAALPAPSGEVIRHIFGVQAALQLPHERREALFDKALRYAPLVDLCQKLAGHRVVLARRGDTTFSKQKILTGGHIDAGLIREGEDAAVETGILLKLYNKCYPNNVRIIQIFGHSAASAIVEAALCASCPQVDDQTGGQFRIAEPHVFDFVGEGQVVVSAVSRDSLTRRLAQDLGV